MPKIHIYNQKGEQIGEENFSDKVFGVKINPALVHQAVVTQTANERQVLAHTKVKSEVRGGGKKPWKQKGTGRARAGSSRSPLWVGGGVTFGPLNVRNFSKKINKKMKQGAIFMALSDRLENNNLLILDKLEIENFKTKTFIGIVEKLEKKLNKPEKKEAKEKTAKKPRRSMLLVNDKKDEKVINSGRNIAGVKVINFDNVNIVDLLKFKNLVLTLEVAKKFEKNCK